MPRGGGCVGQLEDQGRYPCGPGTLDEVDRLLLGEVLQDVHCDDRVGSEGPSSDHVERIPAFNRARIISGGSDLFCRDVDSERVVVAVGTNPGQERASAAADFDNTANRGPLVTNGEVRCRSLLRHDPRRSSGP